MQALATLLLIPLILLNFFGLIIAGIWLGILGEWQVIGLGFLGLFGGAILITILLAPGMLLLAPGFDMYEKGGIKRILSFPILLFSLIWTYLVMSAWALLAFKIFLDFSSRSNLIPILIWSYSVATGPWSFMASKEQNEYSNITIFFLQLACLALMGLIYFRFNDSTAIISFFSILAISMLFSFSNLYQNIKNSSGSRMSLLKPKEVKAALQALEKEEDKIQSNMNLHIGFKLIKNDIKNLLDDSEKTIYSIKNEGLPAKTLVHLLMTNVIQDYLCSGQYHTYRGILSMQGHALLELWDFAVNEMLSSGHYSDEEAEKDLLWIRERIKEVG